MRLINTNTLKIEEWFNNVPPYAILSHTWGEGEVTLGDWSNLDEAKKKKGYRKIELTCQQAARDGLHYAWVDTNCIDKTSSAELSEAINSMFAWYRDSEVCYAFLEDVVVPETLRNGSPAPYLNDPAVKAAFIKSKWFTRGWTLQELLAPSKVLFFSFEWLPLSNKDEQRHFLSEITGIDSDYINRPNRIQTASVGRRMSWMAKRKTTRSEDIAYCMLGIFGIHMALLYGEGHRAFLRLQEEIIRMSNDQTIFCWQASSKGVDGKSIGHLYEDLELYGNGHNNHRQEELQEWTSILAPHPVAFRDSARYSSNTENWDQSDDGATTDEQYYSITNFGLSISLPLLYTSKGACAVLDVGFRKTTANQTLHVLIPLHRVQTGQYIRLSAKIFITALPAGLTQKRTRIFVDYRNSRPRGSDSLLSLRLSSRLINMSDVDQYPVLFLMFNKPVDIDLGVVGDSGMDFISLESSVQVNDNTPGSQGAVILTGRTAKSRPFQLLIGVKMSSAPVQSTKFRNRYRKQEIQPEASWHADIWNGPQPDPSRWKEEMLKPLIDQLPTDFFGSWCTSGALKNVLSWRYSPRGASICYFELDEMRSVPAEEIANLTPPSTSQDDGSFSQIHRTNSKISSLHYLYSMIHEERTDDDEYGNADARKKRDESAEKPPIVVFSKNMTFSDRLRHNQEKFIRNQVIVSRKAM